MLQVEGISYAIGDRQILSNVSFSLESGEKVALVGVNGAGKSTLVKIIIGELFPEEGDVIKPKKVGYVPQIIPEESLLEEGMTIKEFMLEGRGLNKIAQELEKSFSLVGNTNLSSEGLQKELNALAELQEKFSFLGGYEAESEIETVLRATGVSLEIDRDIATLSGGEKTRVMFARAIFSESDLLILDEPTNHIDREYYGWLGRYLKQSKKTILVVSHYPEFINPLTEKILEIEKFTGKIREYSGTYEEYVQQSKVNEDSLKKQISWLEKEIKRLDESARRLQGGGPNKANAAQNMFGRIDRLKQKKDDIANEMPRHERKLKFSFSAGTRPGKVVVETHNVSKSFDEMLFQSVSFKIQRGEKVVVLGPNGSGKTTLMRILMGLISPDSGRINLGLNVSLGYYAQEHENLDEEKNVIDEVKSVVVQNQGNLRNILARFLFNQHKVFQKVKTLSLGEKSRLSLCKLIVGEHNLLILDEPTNYLDPSSRDAIADAICDYEGAVIFISHDKDFILNIKPKKAIVMPGGKMMVFSENLLDL